MNAPRQQPLQGMPQVPTPIAPKPGRLRISVDDAVEHFRAAMTALDSGRLIDACEPIRVLRIYGIGIKWTPSPGVSQGERS